MPERRLLRLGEDRGFVPQRCAVARRRTQGWGAAAAAAAAAAGCIVANMRTGRCMVLLLVLLVCA
eukprot:219012-Chlamydomonas_euryale.AAC.1